MVLWPFSALCGKAWEIDSTSIPYKIDWICIILNQPAKLARVNWTDEIGPFQRKQISYVLGCHREVAPWMSIEDIFERPDFAIFLLKRSKKLYQKRSMSAPDSKRLTVTPRIFTRRSSRISAPLCLRLRLVGLLIVAKWQVLENQKTGRGRQRFMSLKLQVSQVKGVCCRFFDYLPVISFAGSVWKK